MTIKEIAAELGLSTTTVSNVIHGKTSEVSEEKILLVKEALVKYNYVPNISARNLASNRSSIVGVAFINPDPSMNYLMDAFVAELVGSIEVALTKSNYLMMLAFVKDVEELADKVRSWNVDGVIAFAVQDTKHLQVLNSLNKPIVYIDSFLDNPDVRKTLNNPSINLYDYEGAYEITKYLLDKGHKKIGYMSRSFQYNERTRFEGMKKAMEDAGLTCTDDDHLDIYDPEGVLEGHVKRVLNFAKKYTALFCYCDFHALQVINILQKNGIRVPEDISIVGYDDNIYARLSNPAITTMKQSPTLKGRTAVRSVLSQIENKEFERGEIYLPVELVERDSVKQI